MEGEENETRLCHDVGATTQNTDSFFPATITTSYSSIIWNYF